MATESEKEPATLYTSLEQGSESTEDTREEELNTSESKTSNDSEEERHRELEKRMIQVPFVKKGAFATSNRSRVGPRGDQFASNSARTKESRIGRNQETTRNHGFESAQGRCKSRFSRNQGVETVRNPESKNSISNFLLVCNRLGNFFAIWEKRLPVPERAHAKESIVAT